MMKSLSQDLEQGGGVKRRAAQHQQQQSQQKQQHHHAPPLLTSQISLGGEKKKTPAFERRIIVLRRLLISSSRAVTARHVALPLLIFLMLVPICIFHAMPLSTSSTSSLSLQWPFRSSRGSNRRRRRSTMTEPNSLYGQHYRAVEYAIETGHVTIPMIHHQQQSSQSNITIRGKEEGDSSSSLPLFRLRHGALQEVSNAHAHASKRKVTPMMTRKQIEALENSEDYEDGRPDKWENRICKAQLEWQKAIFTTCNIHHELDMTVFHFLNNSNQNQNKARHHLDNSRQHDDESLRLLANGYYRDVWVTSDAAVRSSSNNNTISNNSDSTTNNNNNNKIVLKTIRYEHDFDLRNYDRHRRDAIAMERLSSSPFVLDIYASCANSGLTEYAPGGSIKDAIFPKRQKQQKGRRIEPKRPSKLERLQMAVQAAMGLQALHSVGLGDDGGAVGPTISHTDISPDQFVRVGDFYKLNDFNRARFIRKNREGKTCPFRISQASGMFRSPEEYDKGQLTEKIDIYSLGNIFFMLLTDKWPWADIGSSSDAERAAKKRVIHGERPAIPKEIATSTDLVDQVLQKAMLMCQANEPSDRATAAQVATLLKEALQQLDPGRLQQWGVAVK